jgi:hypothetical protein
MVTTPTVTASVDIPIKMAQTRRRRSSIVARIMAGDFDQLVGLGQALAPDSHGPHSGS